MSIFHSTFNQVAESLLSYPSTLLTQACSLIASGTGKFRTTLLALKASFFTRITSIFYPPLPVAVLPPQSEKIEPLAEQETLPIQTKLLELPAETLYAVTEKLGPRDKLRFLSTCLTLRYLLPQEQTARLPFQVAHDSLFNRLWPFNQSRGKQCYREILLRLLDPGTTDLKHTAVFTERLHMSELTIDDITEILKQVLQQSAMQVSQQWKKLASVNLHLCVTLSGIATMEKLAEYGVDRHFFSGHFPTGNIQALLNQIKETRSLSALDCALTRRFREIAVVLITSSNISDLCIADVLITATCIRDRASLALLLENKINVNLQHDEDGDTALICASTGRKTDIVQLLLNHGANVNLQNKDGKTALIAACRGRGREQIVQLLLNHGANTNIQDQYGWTALMGACSNGYISIISLLLGHGANVNLQNKVGKTALMEASSKGQQQAVQLLLNRGANIELQDGAGLTAFMHACSDRQIPIAQLLLDHGADVNVQDKNGWSALIEACWKGDVTIAKLLLDRGANTELQAEGTPTALAYACLTKNKTLVELLLQHGAEITFEAFSVAMKTGDNNIIRLFLMQPLRNLQQQAGNIARSWKIL